MGANILNLIKIFIFGFISQIYLKFFVKYDSSDEENIEGQVAVVTGADGGIGKALTLNLAKRGAKVVMGCLDLNVGKKAMNEVCSATGNQSLTVHQLDLSDMDSVRSFAKTVKTEHPKIKFLFNVAGIGSANPKKKTKDGFQIHVAINHLGHFLLTNLLLPNIKAAKPARIVAVSSSLQLLSDLNLKDIHMENVEDYGLGDVLPYANTKFMNALFIKELGKRVAGTGITTYAMCPGVVDSPIWDNTPLHTRIMARLTGVTTDQACYTILMCALSPKLADETGKMYRFMKPFPRANARLDSALAKDLWELSTRLVKLENTKN